MLSLTFAALAVLAQNDNVIDEIVWIVGDEAIFKSEVEEYRIDAQMQGVRWDGDPYCRFRRNWRFRNCLSIRR